MTRMSLLFVLFVVTLLSGCKVTAGLYVEKDWQTDTDLFKSPDLRTKAKLEMTRDFESWDEVVIPIREEKDNHAHAYDHT